MGCHKYAVANSPLGSLRRSNAPVTMEGPGALLALLAAILGAPAPTALGKLTCVLLPLPALIVGALPDAAAGIVFAAEIPHHHAGPVLHVGAVVPNGELLDEGEEIEVVGQ